MSNLDNLRFSLSPSCLKQVKAVHAFPLFVLLHAMVDAPHARSSSSFTSSPTLDRPPSAASSWTSFTKTASLFPRRRFRLAFLLALSTAFTLWMSMLLFYSTQQKPPKTSGSEQVALNLNATPEPIEPLHITWPQFRSWQTG
ncbi:hypothetical protein BCR43DRAFT_214355 [Syncephalastrum racemosum]|uniref:Uncharacterized protein n=1 Tax=Syncephalastrum racemosum TaxID=13706 RepID=A0A1X2HJ08_SYNRA|nr:hypothetical protein BCR43DRAFT_214355 [Syncephalastrum racemosum]